MTPAYIIAWALVVHGLTQIITVSKIARPLRLLAAPVPLLGEWIRCAMCFGFWAGIALSLAGFGLLRAIGFGRAASAFGDGCAASALAYAAHVVQVRLGSDKV